MDNISKGLFSQTGKRKDKQSDCTFGELKKTRSIWKNDKKNNYLDYLMKPEPETIKTQTIKNVKYKIKNCGQYGVFEDNCEHLATFVRYGDPLSLQVSARFNSC